MADLEAQITILEKNNVIIAEEKQEYEQKMSKTNQDLQSEIGHEKKRNLGIKSKNEILEK